MSVNSKMTALADEIRELSGTTTTKSIDAMTIDVDAANTEISEQMDLIAQITSALEGKAAGGVNLPSLTNPASASDILKGKEAINGAGNKITGTIATQAAKTITPSTSSQTAVASGVYTTGVITVAGDANLIASNIKNGVSIFGVAGNYEGSGGSSGGSAETCTISITGMADPGSMIYYIDDTGAFCESDLMFGPSTYKVMKNSILGLWECSTSSVISGAVKKITGGMYYHLFYVTG